MAARRSYTAPFPGAGVQGSALIQVLIVSAALFGLTTAAMVLGRSDLAMSNNAVNGTKALWLAAAGSEIGKNWLETNLGAACIESAEGCPLGTETLADGTYTVTVARYAPADPRIRIRSVGTAPGSARKIVEEVLLTPAFNGEGGLIQIDGAAIPSDLEDPGNGPGIRIPSWSIDGRGYSSDGTLDPNCAEVPPIGGVRDDGETGLPNELDKLRCKIVQRANECCNADGTTNQTSCVVTPGLCLPGVCSDASCLTGSCTIGACAPGDCTGGSCIVGTCLVGSCLPGACLDASCAAGYCQVDTLSCQRGSCALGSTDCTAGSCSVGTCTSGITCADTDPTCVPATCNSKGNNCRAGTCTGNNCTVGSCSIDACAPGTCTGNSCTSGTCAVTSCGSGACPDGTCVASSCAVSGCSAGEICSAPPCVTASCPTACTEGTSCTEGDASCTSATCGLPGCNTICPFDTVTGTGLCESEPGLASVRGSGADAQYDTPYFTDLDPTDGSTAPPAEWQNWATDCDATLGTCCKQMSLSEAGLRPGLGNDPPRGPLRLDTSPRDDEYPVRFLTDSEVSALQETIEAVLDAAVFATADEKLCITDGSLRGGTHIYGDISNPKITIVSTPNDQNPKVRALSNSLPCTTGPGDGVNNLVIQDGAVFQGAGILILPRELDIKDATFDWKGLVVVLENGKIVALKDACGGICGGLLLQTNNDRNNARMVLDQNEASATCAAPNNAFSITRCCDATSVSLKLLERTLSWTEVFGG